MKLISHATRALHLASALVSFATDRTPFRFLPREAITARTGCDLWRGPLLLRDGTREALEATAPARAGWRVYALNGSQVRTSCAVLSTSAGAVTFTIEASSAGRTYRSSLTLEAAGAWREVRLVLPRALTGAVEILLTAEAVDPLRHPAVAWGDPLLERRPGAGELAVTAVRALRMMGLRGLARRGEAAGRQWEEDDRYRRLVEQREATDRAAAADAVPLPEPGHAPTFSIVCPVFNTDPIWLQRAVDSVTTQSYPSWELCLSDDGSTDARTLGVLRSVVSDPRVRVVLSGVNQGIVGASNAALACARGEFVGFMDHDDELHRDALAEIARRLAIDPALDLIYTDEDKIDASGVPAEPHFKPDWSPELLRSCMYTSHFTVMRRSLVHAAGGFRPGCDGAQDYDLMLRVTERTDRIAHVPRVLYHWRKSPQSAASSRLAKPWAVDAGCRALEDAVRREGVPAKVTPTRAAGHFRVDYAIVGRPRVSIVIVPGASRGEPAETRFARCLQAIARSATACCDCKVVVASTSPLPRSVLASTGGVPCTQVTVDTTNIARLVNHAAIAREWDHLLVLEAHVEPLHPGWLEAMLSHSQRPGVGAVGPFLVDGDGRIAHAGIVTGVGNVADEALRGWPAGTTGYLSNALDVRNCVAVAGSCLLTARVAFEAVGGFDESVGQDLYDVDYGLSVRRAGYRVVVTPHARLRVRTPPATRRTRAPEEVARLRAKWGRALEADPYYNPQFDRGAATFRLPPALLVD